MLWISVYLPHLAMELCQPQQPGPAVVTDGTGARRRIIACNTTAIQSDVVVGMDAPSAMMREPELRMFDRSKAEERRATLAITSWAHQFTSDVCLDVARWMVWLEVGSSLRIGPLPLAGLNISDKAIDQLHTTGLRTVEDLLGVPSDALARRFGEELPHYLQRLLGERADVRGSGRTAFLEPQCLVCSVGLCVRVAEAPCACGLCCRIAQ